ncbi:kallikrein-1 [Desmodus rotundus]|uniref:kallikrein-1 n=1 Tax=Desmodus rotundus TaxID=9430 RepID=UPI0023810E60|nr:kallikrein-1 [Desmodus rotundus]
MRAFKSFSGRLFSCWFATCLPLDTSATMWFPVLCLALSAAGAGAAPTASAIQSRIIGGWECKKDSHPWQVALYHYHELQCGGVLIHPQWVLTAAHCISKNYQLWLGVHNVKDVEYEGQYVQVSQSFPHPQFNMSLLKNHTTYPGEDYSYDLMLLRLEKPAQITDTVGVLDLPTQEPQLGSICYASGWGSYNPYPFKFPEKLQCVDLELLSNEHCVKAHPEKITDVMLCAGHLKGGKDTCLGDSGGPLICDGVFQGVTSWGHIPCGRPKKPGVFTKLVPLLDWIKETMAANS